MEKQEKDLEACGVVKNTANSIDSLCGGFMYSFYDMLPSLYRCYIH